ncbi:3-hydroxyisobutyrate dehydrogenase [Pseudodonghicola flavimaris]|uniref:3-hydroxyisobutyrate dehydrogenase n=1 Tax=Pseudodonghicola flavimaris TaxID=3050036 RepID=A0ABT7F874_9RHOB|nr:3-hydroxyisobutyrate dehydrogenase [Pseudodonghicola flavimaris]MDK3020814.1 3-hydroxyisobutyrate dehydrogenase [Pseudodonghicola flavimaris]
MRAGFIGLGTMGRFMAANLCRDGHQVRVYNRSEGPRAELRDLGATVCETPTGVIEDCDVVFTMLPDGAVVSSILAGENGLFAASAGTGRVFVDSSTIAPGTARELGAEAARYGVSFMDAPVSGGPAGAETGNLVFMVGGSDADLERVRPVFDTMGRKVFHTGPVGNGQSAKVCNNMLAATIMAATSETLSLGERLGLDPDLLSEILANSSGGSTLLQTWNPFPAIVPNAPSSRDYEGGFQMKLMVKDIRLALDEARLSEAPVPMGSAAHALYVFKANTDAAAAIKDYSKVIEIFRAKKADAAA